VADRAPWISQSAIAVVVSRSRLSRFVMTGVPGFRWDDEFGDFVIPMSANNFAAHAPPVKRSRAVIRTLPVT
jgi:hypothetical protein